VVGPDGRGPVVSARDEILGRVRTALRDVPATETPHDVPVVRPAPKEPVPEDVELFRERVEDYQARVVRCAAADLPGRIAEALDGAARVLVPVDLPGELVPAQAVPDAGLSTQELDAVDAVVTTAALGIAETGTIVLDHGPGQGRRAATLVPDRHVCVVRTDQVVPDVTTAVSRLDPARPLTWISGPSATSDIELDRVEGVHGPRLLTVLLVG
jgi:L-lactate dehydrogenase complex protein LldG